MHLGDTKIILNLFANTGTFLNFPYRRSAGRLKGCNLKGMRREVSTSLTNSANHAVISPKLSHENQRVPQGLQLGRKPGFLGNLPKCFRAWNFGSPPWRAKLMANSATGAYAAAEVQTSANLLKSRRDFGPRGARHPSPRGSAPGHGAGRLHRGDDRGRARPGLGGQQVRRDLAFGTPTKIGDLHPCRRPLSVGIAYTAGAGHGIDISPSIREWAWSPRARGSWLPPPPTMTPPSTPRTATASPAPSAASPPRHPGTGNAYIVNNASVSSGAKGLQAFAGGSGNVSIINTGDLNVHATATYAAGIVLGDAGTGGYLNNSGNITMSGITSASASLRRCPPPRS